MGYRTLRSCVADLERTGQLVRIEQEVDAQLEAAEIQRRVNEAQGPAIFFSRVKDCHFPMVSNLFGTTARARFIFRDTLTAVENLFRLKIDPGASIRAPWRYWSALAAASHMLPKFVRQAPVLQNEIDRSQLPQLKSWPDDGGAFITLPAVYSEDADQPGWRRSNLGMYRVQISGGSYAPNEVGLHYQIHRGIGVHHSAAIRRGERFPVNVFIGGPPATILSAVMPLPENIPEISFAGALGGHRMRLTKRKLGLPILSEADFCISGYIDPDKQLPEGPFGDHLGYYSLAHEFPVLHVEHIYHRPYAIWPFTTVGRPPQEDSVFGELIHELTAPLIPTVIPGVKGVHAVDAAGVHPLLLAIGSERYTPYQPRRRPQELLTQAHAILGQGQMSLAKYLFIVATEDNPRLDLHDVQAFLMHLLQRVDWQRDLHFQTRTTIDTLDYAGEGLNAGSKLVVAAVGGSQRELPTELPDGIHFPPGFIDPRLCLPGVLAVTAPSLCEPSGAERRSVETFVEAFQATDSLNRFPLIVLVDDSQFAAANLRNFLWVTFTRSNPANDIGGIESFVQDKHWGCRGSMVIDARRKPHHAPPLVPDPEISRRVDRLAERGGPLYGIL